MSRRSAARGCAVACPYGSASRPQAAVPSASCPTLAGSSAIAADLIASADVVLHNFRPGVVERLGLDPATPTSRHPRLVYGFVSGFGTRGPSARPAGRDIAAQAEFAVMDLTGEADDAPSGSGSPSPMPPGSVAAASSVPNRARSAAGAPEVRAWAARTW
ncbi:CoA transferase [Streptomyces sp. NPDC055140]